MEAYGKLADRGTVRYIRQRRFGGRNFKSGYYYFYGTGRICMRPSFHKVNKTVQGKSLTESIILAMIMGEWYRRQGG